MYANQIAWQAFPTGKTEQQAEALGHETEVWWARCGKCRAYRWEVLFRTLTDYPASSGRTPHEILDVAALTRVKSKQHVDPGNQNTEDADEGNGRSISGYVSLKGTTSICTARRHPDQLQDGVDACRR